MQYYHEPPESLSQKTRDHIRALNSLKEEIDHACMVLEWLRRNMEGWDEMLETYLFTDKEIVKIETLLNKRADFVDAIWNVLNWDEVSRLLQET
jgi:hypothetical protein